jgi:hypothetical protein
VIVHAGAVDLDDVDAALPLRIGRRPLKNATGSAT